MCISGKLAPRTFALLVAAALGFGAVQASASPSAPEAADAARCSYAIWKECYDGCVLRYGEGTQASCELVGSIPRCTCLP